MTATAVEGDVPPLPVPSHLATVLPMPLDLGQLLRQTALGEESAFAQLYDAVAPRVHRLVVRVVRDPAQSEEVTQEVFLEVWRTASRFDTHRGSALAWLMTITHRRAVDRVRRTESSRRRDSRFHHLERPLLHDQTMDTVSASMEAESVRRALDVLTALQREAVELAYYGGHTYAEVAVLLDIGTSTAKTRIRDGLTRLRGALEPVA